MEDHFCSLVAKVLPYSGCCTNCMGVHFPAVELDNAIPFSTLSRMSGFLWHSPKWACQFGRFFRYTSGLEVLACSIDINLNYYALTAPFPEPLSKVVATFRGKMQQLFGCIIKDRYKAQQHSLLNPRLPVEFLTKCINSLNKLPNISSWFSFGFGLFVLSLYIWLIC